MSQKTTGNSNTPFYSLDAGSSQSVITPCLGNLFDKLAQVSRVIRDLLVLVVHDVGTDIVEEPRVVGDDHAGNVRLVDKVLFQPSDGGNI
jgi:hypothetical protein